MSDRETIFGIEEQTIEKAQAVLEDEQYQEGPLFEEFAELLRHYQRMYKQFRRVIKLSDSQQLHLKQAYETIEAQKQQVE